MVFDFGDRWERNFYDCAVRTKHFDAGRGQCLRRFHTPNRTSYSPPIRRNDLHVVFPVKGLKCSERLSYFHFAGPPPP